MDARNMAHAVSLASTLRWEVKALRFGAVGRSNGYRKRHQKLWKADLIPESLNQYYVELEKALKRLWQGSAPFSVEALVSYLKCAEICTEGRKHLRQMDN